MSQNNLLENKLIEDYWIDKLSNIELTTNKTKEKIVHGFNLDSRSYHSVKEIAGENPLATFTIFLSIYAFLSSYYLNTDNLIIISSSPINADKPIFFNLTINKNDTLKMFLERTKEEVLESITFAEFEFDHLIDKLNPRRAVRNKVSILGFQLNDSNEFIKKINLSIAMNLSMDEMYTGKIDCDRSINLGEHRYGESFNCLLLNLKNKLDIKLGDLDLLTESLKNELIDICTGKSIEIPENITVLNLLKKQVESTPNAIALVHDERAISYLEFDTLMNRLAVFIMQEFLISSHKIVAVYADKSIETVVALFAIMKAGAAYLPIDVACPEDRIKFILKDADVSLIITQSSFLSKLSDHKGNIFALDIQLDSLPNYNDSISFKIDQNSPAYFIYTSGSTGVPKGCIISHRNLLNYIVWANSYYFSNSQPGNFPLFSPLSFDLVVTSIFSPLTRGCSVAIYAGDMEEMLRAIFMNGFNNALKITPSHISIISELNLKSKNIKTIIVGGEELTFNHLKSLKEIAPEALIYNEYGPTEATVGCVIYQCKGTELKIPIGKPINNTSTFILNDNLCLCPFGVQGEIYISGSSVSQRYLNRPDLTEEHFIQSPFNNEEKLYKTGDIGKLNNNNEIEFFGRNDNQIKLRGYRVELNEIESILNLLENVKQSVVLVKQVNGYDNLVAYICSDLKLNDKEIMRALSRSLPDYMIPVFYVYMSKLPINSNGKIDKTELPEFLQGTAEYIAPRNDTEMMVLKIWEKVLDKDNISMTDNFFSLGGDSIKAIQIASRLYEEGYKMDLEQLFQNSTIEELSTVITLLENFPDQNPVTGIIPLTPIQREFFSWTNIDRHHFNQAILLNLHININQDVLKQVLNRIVEQHDALRIVFQKTKEDIIQEGISFRQINLNIFDLTGMDLEEQAEIIRSESDSLQKSFTFSGEPLIKFILFKSDIGDKLFIVVHHLVIDAVSWRIFLDDLDSLLEQVNNCQEISLSLKTSSYRDWANELIVYSKGKNFLKEVKYWQSVASSASINDLPFDNFKGANLIRNISSTNFLLDAESTNALLTSTNKTYNTKIDDILLTALGLAFYRTFGMAEILVAMENHGRENINSNLNINRTIGWFTSIYPIRISTKYPDDLSKQIKNIKDDMHRVPFNGIGYGILKHYGNQEISESISLSPHVSFNYLGAFDNILKHKKNISVCMDDIGFSESIDRNRTYSIDVVGILLQKELKLTFFYSNEQFNNGTIERLQQNFKKSLLDIIFFCEQQETELTSSDFTYKLLDNEILDNFFE